MRCLLLALVLLVAALAGCSSSHTPAATSAAPVGTPAASVPVGSSAVPRAPLWPHYPSDGASNMTYALVKSFDDHQVPITIYRPLIADAQHKVPVLLHSHGFGSHRAKDPDAFKALVAAGFGVVSFDERGHGDAYADSEVKFMSPDVEVKDVEKVIDTIATWDWVLHDAPNDPRLGTIGGSYGGAFQLMTSIFDTRIDAMVPEITWNDIDEALAPGGAIKSAWVDAFYLSGTAKRTVHFSQEFDEGWAWQASTNTFPAGQAPGVPDLYHELKAASPVSYPGKLKVPTLLVQGMADTLFPLNQAVANLRMLEADNATVYLYTHLEGHIFNTASLSPGTLPQDVGLQGPPSGYPCGQLTDLQIRWHLHFLLGIPEDLGPRVCLATQDHRTLVGPTFPLPGTTQQGIDIATAALPETPGGYPENVPVTLLTADRPTTIAGIPTLRGNLTFPGADAIAYFGLQVTHASNGTTQQVDEQWMPLRITAPAPTPQPFALDLAGVAIRLQEGDKVDLMVSNFAPVFAANAERLPGAIVFDHLHVNLPVVPEATPSLPQR